MRDIDRYDGNRTEIDPPPSHPQLRVILPEKFHMDGYEVEGTIDNNGGSSIVLAAHTPNAELAFKALIGETYTPEGLEHEVFVHSAVSGNPNIVELRDHGVGHPYDNTSYPSVPYLVMERANGNLRQAVNAAGRLDTGVAVGYASQLASGLTELHRRDLAHGDFKAANVLLTRGKEVKVADFGSAAPSGAEVNVAVTLSYAAPEQLRRYKDKLKSRPTPAADQYAFGVVVTEALRGSPPFSNRDPRVTMDAVLSPQYPQLLEKRTQALPAPMVSSIRKAMAQDPKDRYSSVGEFADALRVGLLEVQALPARSGVVFDMSRRPGNLPYMPRVKPTAA